MANSTVNLSTLDGSNGFVFDGISISDLSRSPVSNLGDVNGDGIDDIIIGADWATPDGQNFAGESYVVFGRRSGFSATLALSDLTSVRVKPQAVEPIPGEVWAFSADDSRQLSRR